MKTTIRAAMVAASLIAGLGAAPVALAQVNKAVLPDKGALSKQAMTRMLLTDVTRFGNRVVAVGDRGYIVFSDSNGESWERAETPASLPLLTGVYFPDAKTGWAVGHDSVILKSTDEGKSWNQVHSAPQEQRPLMDILFIDDKTGFAVGGYGQFLETTDGGATWKARKLVESPKAPPPPKKAGKGAQDLGADDGKTDDDKHLNAIVKLADGKLLVVGESGTIAKSTDNGKSWSKIASPYKGSYFGAVQAKDGSVVIYGMRGRIYRADANMSKFDQVENKSVATIMGSTVLPDGAIALTGLAGTLMISRDNGATFAKQDTGTTKAFSSVVLGAPNAAVLVGESGARDVVLASTAPAPAPAAPAKDAGKK
jgi:photosystem II stability/assembly factor-like uncharacterized protein